MTPFAAIVISGLAAAGLAALTLVGVRFASDFTRAHSPLVAAFAAGLLLTIAALHLIPEAAGALSFAPVLIALGFGLGMAIQRGVRVATRSRLAAISIGPVIAIALHAAMDGVIYAIALSGDAFSGLTAVLGLMLHKPAEAVICFVLLQRAGFSDARAFGFAFIGAGLTTLLTAALTAPVAGLLSPVLLAALLALVAGILLHVALTHLFGFAREGGLARATPAVALGVLVAAGLSAAHDHGHAHPGLAADHEDHDHAAAPDFRPEAVRTAMNGDRL